MCAVLLFRRRRLSGGGRLRLQGRNRRKAEDRNDEERFGAHEYERREQTEWPSRHLRYYGRSGQLRYTDLSTAALRWEPLTALLFRKRSEVKFAPPVVRSARRATRPFLVDL